MFEHGNVLFWKSVDENDADDRNKENGEDDEGNVHTYLFAVYFSSQCNTNANKLRTQSLLSNRHQYHQPKYHLHRNHCYLIIINIISIFTTIINTNIILIIISVITITVIISVIIISNVIPIIINIT
jgi:hypothetical protein